MLGLAPSDPSKSEGQEAVGVSETGSSYHLRLSSQTHLGPHCSGAILGTLLAPPFTYLSKWP